MSKQSMRIGPQRGPAPESPTQPPSGHAHSTAAEEMENFRPVPVVGRLPWRSQFRLLALVLAVGLVALALATAALYSAFRTDTMQSATRMVTMQSLLDLDQALGGVVAGRQEAGQALDAAVRNTGAAIERWTRTHSGSGQYWSSLQARLDPVVKAQGKVSGTDPRMLAAIAAARQEVIRVGQQVGQSPAQSSILSTRLSLLAASVVWVIVALILLSWVSWKQQRYQTLSAQAQAEGVQDSIMGLMEHMRILASGDLTRKAPVSEDDVGTLADILNTTVASLRDLISAYKESAERTTEAVRQASDTTGLLVDRSREDLSNQAANGAEVLRLAQGVRHLASLTSRVEQASSQARQAVVSGSGATEQAQSKIGEIRQLNEEAGNRVDRLALSSREVASIATMLHGLADTAGVLSDQAALQSARAGEHGHGFKIVASGMDEMARQIGDNARKVGTLIETALGDIEAARVAMSDAVGGTDEASRLIDVSSEAGRRAVESTAKLEAAVTEMSQVVPEQERIAGVLDSNTKAALERNEEGQRRAQQAAEGIMSLYDIVQSLRAASDRFKV